MMEPTPNEAAILDEAVALSENVTMYFTKCIGCGIKLRSRGPPPDDPICARLECWIVRQTPAQRREAMRVTLRPLVEPLPGEPQAVPSPEVGP